MKKHQWLLLLVLLALLSIPFLVSADVGGNVDYDLPGGDDWGGGWGGDMGFDPFSMFYFGRAFGLSPVWMIGILVVLFLLKRRGVIQTGSRQRAPVKNPRPVAPIRTDEASLERLRLADPNFSKNVFLSRVSNMFLQLQAAWTDKDWKRVRPFEHDQIFHMHNQQLDRFIAMEQTNVIEDIAILDTTLESYEQDGPFEYLNVIIKARFKDYIIEDKTRRVIKGFKEHPVVMTYRWKLMRSRGTETEHRDTMVTQCPNCGANLSIGQNGVCEYCGSEVTLGKHDWVLTQIVPLRQEN